MRKIIIYKGHFTLKIPNVVRLRLYVGVFPFFSNTAVITVVASSSATSHSPTASSIITTILPSTSRHLCLTQRLRHLLLVPRGLPTFVQRHRSVASIASALTPTARPRRLWRGRKGRARAVGEEENGEGKRWRGNEKEEEAMNNGQVWVAGEEPMREGGWGTLQWGRGNDGERWRQFAGGWGRGGGTSARSHGGEWMAIEEATMVLAVICQWSRVGWWLMSIFINVTKRSAPI